MPLPRRGPGLGLASGHFFGFELRLFRYSSHGESLGTLGRPPLAAASWMVEQITFVSSLSYCVPSGWAIAVAGPNTAPGRATVTTVGVQKHERPRGGFMTRLSALAVWSETDGRWVIAITHPVRTELKRTWRRAQGRSGGRPSRGGPRRRKKHPCEGCRPRRLRAREGTPQRQI